MTPAKPLDRYPVIRTRDAEEMRAALARIHTNPELVPEGRDRTLDIAFNSCQYRHIGMSFGKYGSAVRLEFPNHDYLTQLFPIKGKSEILCDGILASVTKTSGVAISAGTRVTVRHAADYEHLTLRIHPAAAIKLLSAITGTTIDGPLRFDPVSNFARPEVRILRDNFLFLVDELSFATAPPPSLLLDEFEQTLMALFLRANRHNYSQLLEREAPDAAPSQVRRAEEYIETNWDQPIGLETLATITGVSGRSLFRTFKKSRGYSPMQFVTQVRRRRKGMS